MYTQEVNNFGFDPTFQLFDQWKDYETAVKEIENGSDVETSMSPLSQFAIKYDLLDLQVHSDSTQMAYRNDGMAMQVSSVTDVRVKEQKISMSFEFSAEDLGLDSEELAKISGEQEIKFNLQFTSTSIKYSYSEKQTYNKQLRKPEDIIYDLAKAIREVLLEDGDESIFVMFDKEAIQSLLSQSGFRDLFDEIVALIGVINSLKLHEGLRDSYMIWISGKGKTSLNLEKKTEIEENSLQIDVNITIKLDSNAKKSAPGKNDLEENEAVSTVENSIHPEVVGELDISA